MVMTNQFDGFIDIEANLRKLSRLINTSVFAILDCCRSEIEAKSKQETNSIDHGQLTILFGCKQGKISMVKDGKSILTQKYIKHFEDPFNQSQLFPSMALVGLNHSGETVGNTIKCYRIYENFQITSKTSTKQFLSYIAT